MTTLSKAPLSSLKLLLDAKFKNEETEWKDLDIDNLLLHLLPLHHGLSQLDLSLLREKINVLRVIEHSPTLFYSDILFFSHSVKVMNNELADFDTFPVPTSLEIAFAITDMPKVLGVTLVECPVFSAGVVYSIKRALVEDGYPYPIPPFDVVGVGGLTYTVPENDPAKKEQAIKDYINAMYS